MNEAVYSLWSPDEWFQTWSVWKHLQHSERVDGGLQVNIHLTETQLPLVEKLKSCRCLYIAVLHYSAFVWGMFFE